MSTAKEQLANDYAFYGRMMSNISRLEETYKELGLLDVDFWTSHGQTEYVDGKSIEGLYIKLEPRHMPGIAFGMTFDGPSLSLVDTTPTLGDAAKILLPKVGRWEKSFSENSNQIRLTGVFNGVRIVLQDTPPDTCTVERIEEEIDVPEQVIAAHTEKKVRYVLKGDCDPLLTARNTQSEPVSVANEDMPF